MDFETQNKLLRLVMNYSKDMVLKKASEIVGRRVQMLTSLSSEDAEKLIKSLERNEDTTNK